MYLAQMVCQRLIVNAGRLHDECQRVLLETFLACPLDKLVEPPLGILELYALGATTHVAGDVIHKQADVELFLCYVNAYALAKPLVVLSDFEIRCHK